MPSSGVSFAGHQGLAKAAVLAGGTALSPPLHPESFAHASGLAKGQTQYGIIEGERRQKTPRRNIPSSPQKETSRPNISVTVGTIKSTLQSFKGEFGLEETRFSEGERRTSVSTGIPAAEAAMQTLTRPPPQRTQQEVAGIAELLKASHRLRQLSARTREALCRVASAVALRHGDVVYTRGDVPDGIYFVLSGCVDMFMSDGSAEPTVHAKKQDGSVFGEAGLVSATARTVTAVVSSEQASLAFLSASAYEQVMRAVMAEDMLKVLITDPSERTEDDIRLVMHGMDGLDLGFDMFKYLPEDVRMGLCRSMTCLMCAKGEWVFTDEGAAEGVYVCVTASIEATNRHLSSQTFKRTTRKGTSLEDSSPFSGTFSTEHTDAHAHTGARSNRDLSASNSSENSSAHTHTSPTRRGGVRQITAATAIAHHPSAYVALGMAALFRRKSSATSAGGYGSIEAEKDEEELLGPGDWFGDFSKDGRARSARVQAAGYVIKISRIDHARIMREHEQREDEAKKALLQAAFKMHQAVPVEVMSRITSNLSTRTLQPGDTLVKQGAPIDEIFFIESGALSCTLELRMTHSNRMLARVATEPEASLDRDALMRTSGTSSVKHKQIALANAVKLEFVGLLDAWMHPKSGWATTYVALQETRVLVGSEHKILPLLSRSVRGLKRLVAQRDSSRQAGVARGLAALASKGWTPIEEEKALVHRLMGTKEEVVVNKLPPVKDLSVPRTSGIQTGKPKRVRADLRDTLNTHSKKSFRFQLAEITAIVVTEAADVHNGTYAPLHVNIFPKPPQKHRVPAIPTSPRTVDHPHHTLTHTHPGSETNRYGPDRTRPMHGPHKKPHGLPGSMPAWLSPRYDKRRVAAPLSSQVVNLAGMPTGDDDERLVVQFHANGMDGLAQESPYKIHWNRVYDKRSRRSDPGPGVLGHSGSTSRRDAAVRNDDEDSNSTAANISHITALTRTISPEPVRYSDMKLRYAPKTPAKREPGVGQPAGVQTQTPAQSPPQAGQAHTQRPRTQGKSPPTLQVRSSPPHARAQSGFGSASRSRENGTWYDPVTPQEHVADTPHEHVTGRQATLTPCVKSRQRSTTAHEHVTGMHFELRTGGPVSPVSSARPTTAPAFNSPRNARGIAISPREQA